MTFLGLTFSAFTASVIFDRVSWHQAAHLKKTEYAVTIPLHPRIYRLLPLGLVAPATDWLWLQSLTDPSLEHVKRTVRAPSFYYLEAVTLIDRYFFDAYLHGGNFLLVVKDDIEGARLLFERAVKVYHNEIEANASAHSELSAQWTRMWQLEMSLGYLYLFELDDLLKASAAFTEAGKHANAPDFLKKLSERIAKKGGLFEVGLRLLQTMRENAKDPLVQHEFKKKQESLFLSQYLYDLNEQFKLYLMAKPSYQRQLKISRENLTKDWGLFIRDRMVRLVDPWGGKIFLNDSGVVDSTTPRMRVFGIK